MDYHKLFNCDEKVRQTVHKNCIRNNIPQIKIYEKVFANTSLSYTR